MKTVRSVLIITVMSIILSLSVLAQDIYIDGEKVHYDETTGEPFAENGVILVPLYPTFEAFGNDGIIQDNPNGTVVITKGDISVSCNTADSIFIRNGTKINAPAGLVWRGGPLFVPTEIFSAFDADVYVNGSGVIITRKDSVGAAIFGASDDETFRGSKYFGAKYEPANGLYLGCDTISDPLAETERFTEIYGKQAAAFTVYADINDPFTKHEKELQYAAESGKLVRFVLSGVDYASPDTERIAALALFLEASGARILFDPAPSKICEHSEEYCDDADEYRTAFTAISGIFKGKNPSVATVWQICTCASEKALSYYPGDMYTDYVETVICRHDADAFGNLPFFMSAYGYKKPLILEADISPSAMIGHDKDFCLEFCTYLPVRYPQIKMAFFPSLANESIEPAYLNAIRTGVSAASFIESPSSSPSAIPYWFEMGSGIEVPASKLRLNTSYVVGGSDVSYVIYRLNGEQIPSSPVRSIPYETEIDLAPYAGKTVSLDTVIYDSSNVPCAHKSYTLNVSTKIVSETKDNEVSPSPYGYIAAILIAVVGIFVVLKKINDIFC